MNRFKMLFTKTQTYVFLIIIAYIAFVSIKNPLFLTGETLLDILKATCWMWILGMAVLVVLVSGGFDLSYTVIAVCSTYIAIMITVNHGIDSLALTFVLAIIAGAAYGAINALLIYFFNINSFFVTLGTRYVFMGIMAFLVGVSSLNYGDCPKSLRDFGVARLITFYNENGTTYGLTVFIIPLVIIVALTWFLLYRTRIGRSVYAMGNSQEAAKRVGINLLATHLFVYIYCGILSAIAGVLSTCEVAWLAPTGSTLANGVEMTIIAAVIVGGVKMGGGEGTILGAILGVLLVRLFETTLVFVGLTSVYKDFFTGLVLLVCMSITSMQRYHKRRRLLLFDE